MVGLATTYIHLPIACILSLCLVASNFIPIHAVNHQVRRLHIRGDKVCIRAALLANTLLILDRGMLSYHDRHLVQLSQRDLIG